MANAVNWSPVIVKDRRSQFCFDYGKQEGDPADHTIHMEIKNFLEFTRNKSNAILTTSDVDIQGSKSFLRAYMLPGQNPRFYVVVCSHSDQPPLVSASLQLQVVSTEWLSPKYPMTPFGPNGPKGNKFFCVFTYENYTSPKFVQKVLRKGALSLVISISIKGKCFLHLTSCKWHCL